MCIGRYLRPLLALLASLAVSTAALAHPWGGLVVDAQGNVYFTFTCPIDGDGHVACVYRIDAGAESAKAVLIASSDPSDLILARSPSRQIYAAERVGTAPYRTRLWHLSADTGPELLIRFSAPDDFAADPFAVDDEGQVVFAHNGALIAVDNPALSGRISGALDRSGVTTDLRSVRLLAAAAEGALLAVIDDTVLRIQPDGVVQRLAAPLRISDPPGLPFNGANIVFDLAIDGDRQLFAYYGNREVIEIDSNGDRSLVLSSEPPWSPHGVDRFNGKTVILESTTPPPAWKFWASNALLPRIRVVDENGAVSILYRYSPEISKD